MDQQKTGKLIAEQRHALGLTQKQLAEKLSISDRTVSKWERGAGFPDISLIEPLADALNLTVLEIFHGQLETPAPQEESSAREVLKICAPQMEQKTVCARRWVIALAAILAIVIILMPLLIATASGEWILSDDIPAEEAVEVTPHILISTSDQALLNRILADEFISSAYSTSFSGGLQLTGTDTAEYLEHIDIDGEKPLFMDILVNFHSITVSYGTPRTHIVLEIRNEDVLKQVILCEYPYLTENGTNIPMGQRHGNRIDLNNTNNEIFRRGGYQTGWLELFRTTYY